MDIEIKNEIMNLIGDSLECPANIEGLNKIIELKNKLTKQLNNINDQISSVTEYLEIPTEVIKVSDIAIPIAEGIIMAMENIPSTVSTPIPVGPILQAGKAIEKAKKAIGQASGKIKSGESMVSSVGDKLNQVIMLLDMVDLFIMDCAEKIGGTPIEQEKISEELLKMTQEQSQQLSPVVTNINGFEMGVITEVTYNPLKRRRAIAKNKAGIIMLKGEWSFSSNDQILINELTFKITQDNLKAD